MTDDVAALLEQAVDIEAPIESVWALVSDVRRMAEWSPQVTSTRVSAGFDEVATGTRLTQRREMPDGLSPLSAGFTDKCLSGQAAFTASQLVGMRETLEAIKVTAER